MPGEGGGGGSIDGRRRGERLARARCLTTVGRLAAGVAHGFGDLITAVAGHAGALADSVADPVQRGHVEAIQSAAARAAALAGQLLAFARMDQAGGPRAIDVDERVRHVADALRLLLGSEIGLELALDGSLPLAHADPSEVDHSILDLVADARDALPGGGRIRIETHARPPGPAPGDRGRVVIAVLDSGRVDGRIWRGVAVARSALERDGGRVEVSVAPGRGTTVRLILRAAAAVREPEASVRGGSPDGSPGAGPSPGASPSPRSVAAGAGRASETLLVVEDDEIVRSFVREVLSSSGYRVLEAADGPAALRVCEGFPGPIDLLATDVVMPGMSGYMLARHLEPLRREMKVLFISGYAAEVVLPAHLLGPGMAFLQKPFSPAALLAKVRETLDAATTRALAPAAPARKRAGARKEKRPGARETGKKGRR